MNSAAVRGERLEIIKQKRDAGGGRRGTGNGKGVPGGRARTASGRRGRREVSALARVIVRGNKI